MIMTYDWASHVSPPNPATVLTWTGLAPPPYPTIVLTCAGLSLLASVHCFICIVPLDNDVDAVI